MNTKTLKTALSLWLMLGLLSVAQFAVAADTMHKLVIQVSSDDALTQNMALNNAVNVQKALGQDNVIIEIVAYGPGLSMLAANSKVSERIPSLAMQDISFSACGNTKTNLEQKTGKEVVLLEGVKIVPAGVLRIMELQEQGYSYLRP